MKSSLLVHNKYEDKNENIIVFKADAKVITLLRQFNMHGKIKMKY